MPSTSHERHLFRHLLYLSSIFEIMCRLTLLYGFLITPKRDGLRREKLTDICHFLTRVLGFVGKLRRRPESEPFFRLAKTAKQAMFVLSSMQPDAANPVAFVQPQLR